MAKQKKQTKVQIKNIEDKIYNLFSMLPDHNKDRIIGKLRMYRDIYNQVALLSPELKQKLIDLLEEKKKEAK